MEYLEKENRARVEISWNGESFNPLASGDELSLVLIRHTCPDTAWKWEGDRNVLTGTV